MLNYRRWRADGATYFFTVVTYDRRPLFADPVGRAPPAESVGWALPAEAERRVEPALHDVARRCLRRALAAVRQRWPFDMFACVLLPDHLHCIWTLPPDDNDFPLRWANVKRLFTQTYLAAGGTESAVSTGHQRRHERGIWQPRYWEHLIRDDRELYAYRDYIHLNPVKHGYVRDPTAWPWSSVHRHLRLGWLDPSWTGWTPIEIRE